MTAPKGLFDSPRRLPTLAAAKDLYDQLGSSGYETLTCGNCGRPVHAHYDDPEAGTGCILDEGCPGFRAGRLPHAITKHLDVDSAEGQDFIAGLDSNTAD